MKPMGDSLKSVTVKGAKSKPFRLNQMVDQRVKFCSRVTSIRDKASLVRLSKVVCFETGEIATTFGSLPIKNFRECDSGDLVHFEARLCSSVTSKTGFTIVNPTKVKVFKCVK